MIVRMTAATHKGRVRSGNQDALWFEPSLHCGIVADGLGGRRGGDVASRVAVETVQTEFLAANLGVDDIDYFLRRTFAKIHQALVAHGRNAPELSGMGTTADCLIFARREAIIAHIGDSRTYLYDRQNFWQLTIDHNVQEFVRRRWIANSAVARAKPGALTRALGLDYDLTVDVTRLPLRAGQILLTCSDGLSCMMSDAEIARMIGQNVASAETLPDKLIAEANRRGGRDNVTVMISIVEQA